MEIYNMNIHRDINPSNWAENQFNGLQFTDKRRTQRVKKIATSLASHPGLTIPQLFTNSYDIKAAYNLFKHPQSTPQLLQAPHNSLVHKIMNESGTYLLIEDTSQLSWSGQQQREGLGAIGSSAAGEQGFLLHTTLAVKWFPITSAIRPYVEVVGIANQEYYFRNRIPNKNKKEKGREKAVFGEKYEGESELWNKIFTKLPSPKKEVRWVRVCDRGADIYEVLLNSLENDYGFVIRASKDRALEDDKNKHLFDVAREGKILGRYSIELRSRKKQEAREALLEISTSNANIRSPRRKGADLGKLSSIPLNIVRVVEKNNLEDPIEWILLTDREVNTFEEALEIVLQYSTRWIIEEFHKALKTGLGAENLQLETASRLVAAISIMSLVALRLIDMRERWRLNYDTKAEESGLTKIELEILRKYLKRKIETSKDVALALGRLGGHMNRKRDGMPGILTLWRGMKKLHLLCEGYILAN